MEEVFSQLVTASVELYQFLGELCFVEPDQVPDKLRGVHKAYLLVNGIVDDMADMSRLECRQFTYDELCWMPFSFVDKLNSATIADRLTLLADAQSAWDIIHSPLKVPPPCPLTLAQDYDNSVEGIDF